MVWRTIWSVVPEEELLNENRNGVTVGEMCGRKQRNDRRSSDKMQMRGKRFQRNIILISRGSVGGGTTVEDDEGIVFEGGYDLEETRWMQEVVIH